MKKSAFFFRSNRPSRWKKGQKRPFLITKTQCERIPSPRGHQLQVIFSIFRVFFHLFFWAMGTHWFSENSDGLIKTFALRRDATFYSFSLVCFFFCHGYLLAMWKKKLGVLALWPLGMSKKSIFMNFIKIFLNFLVKKWSKISVHPGRSGQK